ncbi:hypothetical protein VU05_04860, partial [Desulfobulbus sp. F1]|nr:hypothetical protein [Desulfobulbus sp. F1]
MKKIVILILLLTGITGAAFYYAAQRSTPPAGSEYYADYLPADTLAVITLLDLKGLSQAFPKSALGNFFAKQTVREIMAEQGATEEAVQRYEEFYDGVADLFSNSILQQLFGDDATIAQLSPDLAQLKANPEAEQRQRLIAFGTSATAASVDSIARLTMSEVSKETVNGLELTRIRLDDEEFLYGTVRAGVIILAYNPELIAAALKQKESGGGLEAHPFFIAAKKFWAESTPDRYLAKFYANADKLRSLFVASEQKELKMTATYMQGFNSLSGLAFEHQGNFQLKTTLM